jgi:hypothetical protein
VSQISPPIRILLVLAVAVLGAYMLFLRPKPVETPPADPAPNVQTGAPAESEPGKIAEAAQGAVEASNGQLKSQESVDGVDAGEAAAATGTTTESGTNGAKASAAATAVDTKGLPKPIAKAIRHNKVLVLLFWNRKSADDKAVHAAIKNVDRWNGRVYVGSASIKQIAKYGRISRGVDVEQSPTVVVADPELRAETLVGYVDSKTIDQAVVDALRNTTGLFTDAYLRKVDRVCASFSSDLGAVPHRITTSPSAYMTMVGGFTTTVERLAADFAAVKAPAKWRSFRSATVADHTALIALYHQWGAALGKHPTRAQIHSVYNRFHPRESAILTKYDRRMNGERLFLCGEQA